MSLPVIETVDFGGPDGAPLLMLAPSLGTSVTALWAGAAALLTEQHCVVGFDLPGHGHSPAPAAPFTISDLAQAVHHAATSRGTRSYHYAGLSVGGAVGLELLLHHGQAVTTAALICTGAKIGTHTAWMERARTVRARGTAIMLEPAATAWFADGFTGRDPDTAEALLQSLADADTDGYAGTCEALAGFDVRDQLAAITADVLAVAGTDDLATPPSSLQYLARRIASCRYVELAATAHLAAPAEQPTRIAAELISSVRRSHS
ncbi:MAG: alpha/beta fold hydrolase [Mycobacterium sp.]